MHERLLHHRSKKFLSIGRLEDVKNIEFLIEWFGELNKRYSSLELTIAGEYTGFTDEQKSQYQQRIEELVAKLKLENKVTFTGPLVGEAKVKAFCEAYALVNFSTDPGETFGFNLLEAKSTGTPVICTRWDGFKELVKDGEDGHLVQCGWGGDVPVIDMRDAFQKGMVLMEDETLWRTMSVTAQNNSESYRSEHIIPNIVSELARRKGAISNHQVIERIALTPIHNMPELYEIENLLNTGLIDHTPVSILGAENSGVPLPHWFSKVKPIIHHFAEELKDANF
jgi:glycosyltransferase involved in cell wall biosynthesis